MKSQTISVDSKTEYQKQLNDALYGAVISNNLNLTKKLLNAGASPNANNLLSHAVFYGYEKIVLLLLSSGTGINVQNELVIASEKGYTNIVLLLLSSGANPNKISNVCAPAETALHRAVRMKKTKIIELLLLFGAEPDILNRNKESPFTLARKNTKTLECFLNFLNKKMSLAMKKNIVFDLLHKEDCRVFNTDSEDKIVMQLKKSCAKAQSLISLYCSIQIKIKDIDKNSNLYFALTLSSHYLKRMIKLEKEAEKKSAMNSQPSAPFLEIAPTAPTEILVNSSQQKVKLMTQKTSLSSETSEEPGAEPLKSGKEQIGGQSHSAKFSLLSSKSNSGKKEPVEEQRAFIHPAIPLRP